MTSRMTSATDHPADVAIIGAGPIGIELAVALRQAGVSMHHFEAGAIGSTMGWWAPGTRFFSSPERIEIAGVPLISPTQDKATREEYLAYLRGVVAQFDLNVHTFTRVRNITAAAHGFELHTSPSTHGVGGPEELNHSPTTDSATPVAIHRARRVVLAIGNMHRPRMIDVPGEDQPHVSHYLRDPHKYFGRRVLIVGGKNSAVEAAIRLYRVGAKVILSYRSDRFDEKRVKYWLRPELEWLIEKGWISFHPRTVVCGIEPGCVTLADVDDGGSRMTVDVDDVLLLTGYVQCGDLFAQLGIERIGETQAPVFDHSTMRTNVDNVYIAGTAGGGSQTRARLFIENTHVHVQRIVRDIAGVDLPWITSADFASLEES